MTENGILIVEDESIVAWDIMNRLQAMGYAVCGIATTGEDAIIAADAKRPDLVLMDIKLKGKMDGTEAARVIAERFGIPVIYLTAYTDEETVQRARDAVPFVFLVKPIDAHELRSNVEMALYRHRLEQHIKMNEEWLAAILRSIAEGVIATDGQGMIRFMNPVAERLTGWSRDEATGIAWPEVFCPVTTDSHESLVDSVFQTLDPRWEGQVSNEAWLISRTGLESAIQFSAAPIRSLGGANAGLVLVFQDNSARREAKAQMQRYTDELAARNEELDAFAHTVAHDIQSPLSTIMGYAELLLECPETSQNEEVVQGLQTIARTSRKMISITEELMVLAGVCQVDALVAPLEMDPIVAEAIERLADMIQDSDATISLPEEWPWALGYAPWVEEVWVNYLSNAMKYGGNPPDIAVGGGKQGDGMVRFWVRDNGPGLTADEQAQLFKPFTKLSQVRASGSGLGLSIVRRIVEKLGGEVRLESEGIPGRGSVFSFTLPGLDS